MKKHNIIYVDYSNRTNKRLIENGDERIVATSESSENGIRYISEDVLSGYMDMVQNIVSSMMDKHQFEIFNAKIDELNYELINR